MGEATAQCYLSEAFLVLRAQQGGLALAWVPLLIFSVAEGHAWAGRGLPFLKDVELHARFLLAMPLLILAELVVHMRMRPVILQFVERGLIADSTRADFDAAIASAVRLRNSVWAELVIILFVYVVGVGLVWRTQIALDVPSWHGAPLNGRSVRRTTPTPSAKSKSCRSACNASCGNEPVLLSRCRAFDVRPPKLR